MQREQIADLLWPELDAEAAIRDFKVALNALNRALEPARPTWGISLLHRPPRASLCSQFTGRAGRGRRSL